jgi:hypothetical protein
MSSAILTYPDGTVVELGPETTVRISARSWGNGSKGLELVNGRLSAVVAKQVAGQPLALYSDHANAEVVGTRLSFQCDGERTRLEVKEGVVRFIPRAGGARLLVDSGFFAEVGSSGFRSGTIDDQAFRGITGFTLMNADTDEPLREAPLTDGEAISLSALPTPHINIRADYGGDTPVSLRIHVTRDDGDATGLRSSASDDQTQPPFFVAGDYWAEGRPTDCRAWTPRPGLYHISAVASYADDTVENHRKPLEMNIRITK